MRRCVICCRLTISWCLSNSRQLGAIAQIFNKNIDELPTGDAHIEAVGKRVKDMLNKPLTVPLAASGGAPGGPVVTLAKR